MEADLAVAGAVPAHVPPHLVHPFDFRGDLTGSDDAWDALEELNDLPDIFYSPDLGGHWVVTRAPMIEEVFRRYELFSNRSVKIPKELSAGFGLVNMEDPPDHQRFRSILANSLFSPRALAGVEEQARAITRDLIDGFAPRGRCEFVSEFTRPMPVDVFMGLFGMERSLRMAFVPWVEQFFRADTMDKLREATGNINALLEGWVDAQMADPDAPREGHMMTALLKARVDGRPITKQEMMILCFLLVSAALDTTTSQMTHQMRFLAENPAHRQLLIDRPNLIPHAVEVMLRRFGMVNTGRLVRDDINFHGVEMKAGEMVLCSSAIAGLDRRAYPDPRKLSFDKADGRVRHWAFGSGVHICPGAYLARMELRILLEEALPRLPGLRLAPDAGRDMVSGITLSLKSLPLEWDAA